MALRTTLKDIATAVGVSVTAVSQVLNGRPTRISEDKRHLIIQTAQKLHYVPNQNARSLVMRQSKLIALIVPDVENLFFASLASRCEEACREQGYSLLIASSNDLREQERKLIRQLSARDVDGMLLIAANESYRDELALREDIQRVPCPVTLVDRFTLGKWCDAVGFDNELGGRLAAEILLDAGHRNIGCITGDGMQSSANLRVRGFQQALSAQGVPLHQQLCVNGDYRFEGGYAAADQLIDAQVTAVFCCNDVMALGFCERARERRVRVPEDISVVGYDNILARLGLLNALTTIEQEVSKLAVDSWSMLRARIEEVRDGSNRGQVQPWLASPRTTLLSPRVIQRNSVYDNH